MARKPRTCLPGVTYHVYSRCIDRKKLLQKDHYKDLLVKVLARTQVKYKFELISYVIMDNHFHFVIRTLEGEADISRIMQYIKARFAELYNRDNNRTGPFWNERYRDVIVEMQNNPFVYLLWLLWYIGYNPVRKNFASNPRKYRFSSINAYLFEDHVSPVIVTIHEYFHLLGRSFRERVEKFLWYEDAYQKSIGLI